MNSIKLTEITFPFNGNNCCCFDEYGRWVDAKTTKVGEGEDAEELFLGTVEVGETIHCPHCGKNYLLDDKGGFVWVDPEEFDLVDADVAPTVEAGLAVTAV